MKCKRFCKILQHTAHCWQSINLTIEQNVTQQKDNSYQYGHKIIQNPIY